MFREYPPQGIATASNWIKDLSDTVAPLSGTTQYARYKTKLTNAGYGNGWYTAEANTIYGYSSTSSTSYGADEWPPSGVFDKRDASTSSIGGWHTINSSLNNTTDATNTPFLIIRMPHYIRLSSYDMKIRTDGATFQGPTKWTLQGSRDNGATWTSIATTSTSTAWVANVTQTFTQSTSVAYNSFKFIFLRSGNANNGNISLGEVILYGTPEVSMSKLINDEYPSALTSANSFGMTRLLPGRISSMRGLSGVGSTGQIRFSDFLTKYTPSDSLFPTFPFRIGIQDGTTTYYSRANWTTSNATVTSTDQHIYFRAIEDTSATYDGNNKPGYMYYLRDIASLNYIQHYEFMMSYSTTATRSIEWAWRAVPASDAPGYFYIRNPYSALNVSTGDYYFGLDSQRLKIGKFGDNPMIVKRCFFDTSDIPPVTNGLVGVYPAESFNGFQWSDVSSSNNHATTLRGTVTQNRAVSGFGNKDFLSGDVNVGIQFPSGVLPNSYTLFHVAKYNGASRARIFDGVSQNWFSGFHSGQSGKAYHHDAHITRAAVGGSDDNTLFQTAHCDDWIVSTDMMNVYRSNKTNRTTQQTTTTGTLTLSVNSGLQTTERSDWAVATVVAYNRNLTLSEVLQMENWLIRKYNISTYPPIMYGMVGMYTGDSWNGPQTRWDDMSGNGNHVLTANMTGPMVRNYSTLNGRNFLSGTTTTTIVFPTGILPTTYTLFHVCKYNGSAKRRILNGYDKNWLSGFWNTAGVNTGTGLSGVAYHGAGLWLTNNSIDRHGDNWVLSTDQNNLYRSQRVNRTLSTYTGPGDSARLCVNTNTTGGLTEASDWAIACVIVYNRKLNAEEINLVENWIALRYNLADGTTSLVTDATVPTREDPPTSGLVLWMDAMNHTPAFNTWVNQAASSNIYYNFNINSNAWRNDGLVPHFNFEGSYGIAKRPDTAGRDADVPFYNNATVVVFSTIRNNATEYRGLLRGGNFDSQVIIGFSGTESNVLGMFNTDVTPSTFYPSGYNITNLPTPFTSFNMMVFKLATSSPYYQFSHGTSTTSCNITDPNATLNNGITSIGGWHKYTNDPSDASQYWGKIGTFLYYNRHLTTPELIDIYNQYEARYNYPHPGDTRYFDTTGTWSVLYDVTNSQRDANGMIQYNINNSGNLEYKSHTRVAYYMQNKMSDGLTYYAFASMDSNGSVFSYRVPHAQDQFVRHLNTSNLRIFSNHPSLSNNYQTLNGRLEIWNYNYATNTIFGDGSGTVYDYDDTPNLTTAESNGHGCLQVHDITNKCTVLSWTNHRNAALFSATPGIGFGNNDSANTHYAVNGHLDWTFAVNGANNWRFQVLVNTDKNCMDRISTAAKTSLVFGFSLQRLSSTYTGPTVRIRRGSDNVELDFYADVMGNLGTRVGGSGQSLANWLSGAVGYMSIWYDQSGLNHHATQTSTSVQPIIDLVNNWVDFKPDKQMTLQDGALPAGDTPYTVITRHNTLPQSACILSCKNDETPPTTNTGFGLERENADRYNNWWWGGATYDVWGYPPSFIGNTISTVYDNVSSGKTMYVNGVPTGKLALKGRSTISKNIRLGNDHRNRYLNGELYYLYFFSSALTNADRMLCEELGQVIQTNLQLWYDPQDFRCFPGSGTTMTDLSGNNNNGTLNTGATISSGVVNLNGTSTSMITTTWNPSIDRTMDYTLEIWVYNDASAGGTGSGPYALISNTHVDNTNTRGTTIMMTSAGNVTGFERDAFAYSQLPDGPIITNSKWRHIVKSCVSNAKQWKQYLYVDGVLQQTADRAGTSSTHTYNFRFGGGMDASFDNMKLGPIRIYIGKALTNTEVAHNFNVERRRFSV